jgi:Protein of unknown function (DUF3617)
MRARAVPAIMSMLAFAAVSDAASGQARAPIQPKLGNWEVTQQLTPDQAASIADVPPHVLERMGYDPRAKTVRTTLCLNAQAMSRWAAQDREIRATGRARCDDPVYESTGDTMTMTLECTAPVMLRMHTVYRFNAARDAYSYENEVTIGAPAKAVTRRVSGSARRIGDC